MYFGQVQSLMEVEDENGAPRCGSLLGDQLAEHSGACEAKYCLS
jgi:hypothetical protein